MKSEVIIPITKVLLNEYDNSSGHCYRISKEYLWIDTANKISTMSTCFRKKVGAVITNSNMNKIISIGYNGDEKGGSNQCDSHEVGNCGCLHAEVNCIAQAKVDLLNCVIFISVAPCKMCSKLIINSGIKKVIYYHNYRTLDGIKLLAKRDVEVVSYKQLCETENEINIEFSDI
jgi:dCMP deaminase